MFKTGTLVTAIGSFIVKNNGDEYIEFDSFGKGGVEITENYDENMEGKTPSLGPW